MSIINEVDIFEGYNSNTYHIYVNDADSCNPLVYMSILKFIAYHTFKKDSIITYHAKVNSIESNYLHPVYYINNVAHISGDKINYCDANLWKPCKCKYLCLLYFNQEPKEHDGLVLTCNVEKYGTFDTLINIRDNGEVVGKIKLTMTHNGIVMSGEVVEEQEEIDLQ